MATYQQELFNHMIDEHNLILTGEEMREIEFIINQNKY